MLVAMPLVMLVVGAIDLLATVAGAVIERTAPVAASLNLPASLLPVTMAVVFASIAGGRRTRIAVAFGAFVALVARIGLTIGTFALPGEVSSTAMLQSVAGLGLGIVVLAWSVRELLVNKDLHSAQPALAPAPPAPTSATPPPAPHSGPTSPATPVAVAPMKRPAGPWATATTPWPRANEDDPNGTLIRPPRR